MSSDVALLIQSSEWDAKDPFSPFIWYSQAFSWMRSDSPFLALRWGSVHKLLPWNRQLRPSGWVETAALHSFTPCICSVVSQDGRLVSCHLPQVLLVSLAALCEHVLAQAAEWDMNPANKHPPAYIIPFGSHVYNCWIWGSVVCPYLSPRSKWGILRLA